MDIRIRIPGATPEEIERGLAAAKAVFAKAGITSERAADARFAVEGWDEASFPDDESYPDDDDFELIHVWDEADQAAAKAACYDWPEDKHVKSADLELVDPEADARRGKLFASMSAFQQGKTPEQFEAEWAAGHRSAQVVPMGNDDNVIPFVAAIRSEIESELERARARFGPDNIEVMAITGSWGDTMDDRQVLEALRKLNRTGSMFDDITDTAD